MRAREILPWAYRTGSPLLEASWDPEAEADGFFDVQEPHTTEAQRKEQQDMEFQT